MLVKFQSHALLLALSLVVIPLFSGCAVGPLFNHETARTVGNSNKELMGGFGSAGYLIKWTYGLSENLDLGIQWESWSLGLRAKYAFINQRESGWSLAAAAGTGFSIGGSHYYGDIIGSYLTGSWEPYATVRVVHVKHDPVKFKKEDNGLVDFTVHLPDYEYGQVLLGSRFWLNPHWILSLEMSSIFAITRGVAFNNFILLSASLGYRFF